MKRNLFRTLIIAVLAVGLVSAAHAFEGKTVTFDNGQEGWYAGPDCQTIFPDGGNPGYYWNFASRECDSSWVVRYWFYFWNDSDPAFIGDYTQKGPVRLSIDVDVNRYDYIPWPGADPIPVEQYRNLVFEFIDYDNPYTDPDTGFTWNWTSVLYVAGPFPDRNEGWKTFEIDIADPSATELPEGWFGYGGPEDPATFASQLPPDRTFADVMAGVDELRIHSVEPGYFYSIAFLHDMNIDNLSITELPQSCNGLDATVYVDKQGIVHGGLFDGLAYMGELHGTAGDDVIVGTPGNDTIQGFGGNDVLCGYDGDDAVNGGAGHDMIFGGNGDDTLMGQWGNDFIDGGDGRDNINGGADANTCIAGEVVNRCDAAVASPN
jgi:hypothetical protein